MRYATPYKMAKLELVVLLDIESFDYNAFDLLA